MLRHLARCKQVLRSSGVRVLSGPAQGTTDGEMRIKQVLQSKFPGAKTVTVEDISGGCGAMYEVCIEAVEFEGKRTVQQHMLVNEALKEEIENMHGLRINTKIPS